MVRLHAHSLQAAFSPHHLSANKQNSWSALKGLCLFATVYFLSFTSPIVHAGCIASAPPPSSQPFGVYMRTRVSGARWRFVITTARAMKYSYTRSNGCKWNINSLPRAMYCCSTTVPLLLLLPVLSRYFPPLPGNGVYIIYVYNIYIIIIALGSCCAYTLCSVQQTRALEIRFLLHPPDPSWRRSPYLPTICNMFHTIFITVYIIYFLYIICDDLRLERMLSTAFQRTH